MPLVVLATCLLFEYSFSNSGWVNYTYRNGMAMAFSEYNSPIENIFAILLGDALWILFFASMAILAVNLFKYKKIMKAVVFLILLPLIVLYAIAWIVFAMIPDLEYKLFVNGVDISSTTIYIIAFVIILVINYITWQIFKNKQV